AGGDDEIVCADLAPARTLGRLDLDRMRTQKAGEAVDASDRSITAAVRPRPRAQLRLHLVRLLRRRLSNRVHHLPTVDRDVTDPVATVLLEDFSIVLRELPHRLRGERAVVDAGTAEHVRLDQAYPLPEVPTSQGGGE